MLNRTSFSGSTRVVAFVSLRFLNIYGARLRVQADDDNATENTSLPDDEWTDNKVRIFFRRIRILHFYIIGTQNVMDCINSR